MIIVHNVLNNKTEQQRDGANADCSLLFYISVLLDYTLVL